MVAEVIARNPDRKIQAIAYREQVAYIEWLIKHADAMKNDPKRRALVEEEEGKTGKIITFWVKEKKTIRSVKYEGLNSITNSEILEKLREKKATISQESTYDPSKIKKAETILLSLPFGKGGTPPWSFGGKPAHAFDVLLVRLETDAGIVGWGEAFSRMADVAQNM